MFGSIGDRWKRSDKRLGRVEPPALNRKSAMYGVPERFDEWLLVDSTLTQVCVGCYGVTLAFSNGAVLTLESAISVRLRGQRRTRRRRAEKCCASLFKLLGAEVTHLIRVSESTLQIRMEPKGDILLHATNRDRESFCIEKGNRRLVV